MEKDELNLGEPHPAAVDAMDWVKKNLTPADISRWIEAFSSCALSNYGDGKSTRLHDICLGTLKRLQYGEPVSDRYLLGLAWTLRYMMEK